MKDYTETLTKYVIIELPTVHDLDYFRDSRTLRPIGGLQHLISVEEYNRILSEHEADSMPKD